MGELNVYVPLEIGLIEEGRFVENINKALMTAQAEMVKHTRQYQIKAKKAKATIKAEITIVCIEPESDTYGLLAQIKMALPSAPPSVNMLMSGRQDGKDVLFCRKSGSSADHPTQAKLCTEDGMEIDMDSGEVLEEAGVEG